MSGITVNMVVKNEQNWVWFSLASIIEISEKVLICDTGSEDNTVKIIKSIKSPKIKFEQIKIKNAKELVSIRQKQLDETKTEWLMNVDGDEIWPQEAKKELVEKLKTADKSHIGVVARAWNFVGDVYHYHPESQKYHWPYAPKDYLGWANLRLIRTSVPGLHLEGEYPQEAYCDKNGTPVQNFGPQNLIFLKNRYFHTTYLERSKSNSKNKTLNRQKKGKFEFGLKSPEGLKYPASFYENRPAFVPDPWHKRSLMYNAMSLAQTPAKEIRRRIKHLYTPQI